MADSCRYRLCSSYVRQAFVDMVVGPKQRQHSSDFDHVSAHGGHPKAPQDGTPARRSRTRLLAEISHYHMGGDPERIRNGMPPTLLPGWPWLEMTYMPGARAKRKVEPAGKEALRTSVVPR